MKRLSTAIALFSVGTELLEGKTVNTTADRQIHHCTDTRNAISDFRNFYGVEVDSIYNGYVNPITGRSTRYIGTYKLASSIENLAKMVSVLDMLADEVEQLKRAYSLKKEKLKKPPNQNRLGAVDNAKDT